MKAPMHSEHISRRRFLIMGGAGSLTLGFGLPFLEGCGKAEVPAIINAFAELPNLINDYRQQNSLPAIPLSDDLTAVALKHLTDLNTYHPKNTCGTQGNLHSWSNNGNWQGKAGVGAWKGCCYPDDHANASCMWDKPKEIANYPSNGYEIAHWGSGAVTAQSALNSWKSSSAHNAVILNKGTWTTFQWQALGAVAEGNYACAWFGTAKS